MIDTIDALTQQVHRVRGMRAVDVARAVTKKTQQKLAGKQRVEPPLMHAKLVTHRRTQTRLFLSIRAVRSQGFRGPQAPVGAARVS